MASGYYRTPAVFDSQVVFVCEDDLWLVPLEGGIARRITSNLGAAAYPSFSPDGSMLAFTGTEEGEIEVYVMPARGGPAKRVTYLGANHCRTAGWNPEGKVLFTSSHGLPFRGLSHLFEVNADGTDLEMLAFGPASGISFSADAGVVIGRNTDDPARWKRYRGGRTGQLWVDREGKGTFEQLIQLKGNLASPMWIGERIFFLSDHEGIGNLYSCRPEGDDLQRHTDHNEYYARNASTDGKHVVYHAGGNLYAYAVEENQVKDIPVEFLSPQTQRNRKFVSPARYLESWDLHPRGEALAVTARGKLFSFFNWEGAVLPHGEQNGVRYRLPVWLRDGKQILAVTDSEGEEHFVLFPANGNGEAKLLPEMDMGRPMRIAANPRKDQVAFSNHRNELFCLDTETYALTRIDQGATAGVRGFAWSPDGEWLAYSLPVSHHVTMLKLWQAESGEVYPLTRPVLHDVAPAFDPEGKYLYFLSYRHFNPVYDNLHFDLSFPGGMKPYLVTLQKDLPSPFRPVPKFPDEEEEPNKEEEAESKPDGTGEEPQAEGEEDNPSDDDASDAGEQDKEEEKKIQIDLDGIEDRVLAFPVSDGLYGRVLGIEGGKVLYSRYPIEGELDKPLFSTESAANGTIMAYSFESRKEETLIQGVTTFDISMDSKKLIYLSGMRLRVLSAGSKPNREAKDKPGKESGWVDLWRLKVPVVPLSEWKQMFKEAWRLQRDHFWVEDMSKVDWLQIYERYLPLVDRVSCRSEFSDLMWEMQGELGTSHAYEFGGDYRPAPFYSLGLLGAKFAYDESHAGWRITQIASGDSWDEGASSPLRAPGVNVHAGDVLLAVNGTRLGKDLPPGAALVNQARNEVFLTILPQDEDPGQSEEEKTIEPRTVTVRTISNEMPAFYREWVEANRAYVHEVTEGRVGYVHIPGMMAAGYAEFHRGFLAEVDREGLIVDVRFNTGGHVSALILEKLARRRIGYDSSRWSRIPEPYPPESILGPMVALTNEHAGSDGDIFSHAFKLMNLGPLIGVRTWGGVIGISPKQILVDRTITTQPEYSFWFQDVGWGVENYGTDPDIVVPNLPQDYARGVDAQLERAIAEVVRIIDANPPSLPEFGDHPSRSLPRLPKR